MINRMTGEPMARYWFAVRAGKIGSLARYWFAVRAGKIGSSVM
jgi:hypothetical protein